MSSLKRKAVPLRQDSPGFEAPDNDPWAHFRGPIGNRIISLFSLAELNAAPEPVLTAALTSMSVMIVSTRLGSYPVKTHSAKLLFIFQRNYAKQFPEGVDAVDHFVAAALRLFRAYATLVRGENFLQV